MKDQEQYGKTSEKFKAKHGNKLKVRHEFTVCISKVLCAITSSILYMYIYVLMIVYHAVRQIAERNTSMWVLRLRVP